MTLWTAALQASLSFTISCNLLKFMSIELMIPSNHLILSHPTSSPALNLSQHQGFFPMSWLFVSGGQSIGGSASVCPSNEYTGLISFRIDWFDLLAVGRTLKSFLQHSSLKASVLRLSALFMIQLTSVYDYWKNHNLI